MPRYLWNLGINYFPSEQASINLHYGGWDKAWGKQLVDPADPLLFEQYGAEHFLDASLNFHQLFGKDVRMQIYAKNLFNNKAMIPMTIHGGATRGNGAEYGIGVSMRFD